MEQKMPSCVLVFGVYEGPRSRQHDSRLRGSINKLLSTRMMIFPKYRSDLDAMLFRPTEALPKSPAVKFCIYFPSSSLNPATSFPTSCHAHPLIFYPSLHEANNREYLFSLYVKRRACTSVKLIQCLNFNARLLAMLQTHHNIFSVTTQAALQDN